jgi:hypothetical protein
MKGERPKIGTRDCKDSSYVFASVNVIDGQLTTRQLPLVRSAFKRLGAVKYRLLQSAFVKHLDDIARRYPATSHTRVVIIIDNAPWHGGNAVKEALAKNAHLEFYRLPSYSPQLNPIERVWKMLRRRATHNRFFEKLKALQNALRQSIQYYQVMKHRIRSLIANPFQMRSLLA